MAKPRIVGGSSYDNPYAHPVSFDPFGDKLFEAFEEPQRELNAEQVSEDPWAEVKAEFKQAQRRMRMPLPRRGVAT